MLVLCVINAFHTFICDDDVYSLQRSVTEMDTSSC